MLYKDKQLPEIYFMKHLHDDEDDYMDYENNILNKSLSPYMFKNDKLAKFLEYLQKIMSLIFDQNNIIKNWKNYMVDKYYYKHKN